MASNIVAEEATSVASSFNQEATYSPILIEDDGESFSIVNNGTAAAPVRVTIIPKNDIMLLEIKGLSKESITMEKIQAGQILVIDNIDKKVTIDDVDAFEYFNGWELPYLSPGTNEIKITNASQMTINIEYQPAYI